MESGTAEVQLSFFRQRQHAWLNAPQPPDFWRPTKLIARGDDDEGGSR